MAGDAGLGQDVVGDVEPEREPEDLANRSKRSSSTGTPRNQFPPNRLRKMAV
jgi:hypothetical protein